jgi:nitroreductase
MSEVEPAARALSNGSEGELAIPTPHAFRTPEATVDPIFVERWSPRSFLPDPIDPGTLRSLFEAARWAPSSANEQPWLFVYATRPEDRARFAEGLLEMNRGWASQAPVLVYLLTRQTIREGAWAGRPNPHAQFDGGAAWMSLALAAHLAGLSAHAMGGIDREKASELLGVPPGEYDVQVAIAIGRRGPPSRLPAQVAARETPSPRRPLREIAVEGRYPGSPTSPLGARSVPP